MRYLAPCASSWSTSPRPGSPPATWPPGTSRCVRPPPHPPRPDRRRPGRAGAGGGGAGRGAADGAGVRAAARELAPPLRAHAQATAEDTDVLYAKLLENLRRLIAVAGDKSNLILDPDLDTYYLMDAVLLKLPEQQALLSRTALFGKGVVERGRLTEQEKAELIVLVGLLRSNLEALEAGMSDGLHREPGRQRQAADGGPPHVAPRRHHLLPGGGGPRRHPRRAIAMTPEQWDRLPGPALARSFALWEQAAGELDWLTARRIQSALDKKRLVQAFAVVALILVLYLLVAFYSGVMRTVGALKAASQRMVRGEMERPSVWTRGTSWGTSSSPSTTSPTACSWTSRRGSARRASCSRPPPSSSCCRRSRWRPTRRRRWTAPCTSGSSRSAPTRAGRWGTSYVVDGQGILQPTALWHVEDRRATSRSGSGRRGRPCPPAWGCPAVFSRRGSPPGSSTSPRPQLPEVQGGTGHRTPSRVRLSGPGGEEVVAVIEFFSDEPAEPDDAVLTLMAHRGQSAWTRHRDGSVPRTRLAKDAAGSRGPRASSSPT